MKALGKSVLFLLGLITVGCDPGMTIRQANQPSQTQNQVIVIRVPTSRHLIGELNYSPDGVQVTNLSQSPIKITTLELVSEAKTFPYQQVGPDKYPVMIKPGNRAKIPVWFDLDPSYLRAVFKNPVELRVYYERAGAKEFESAFLVGEE